MTDKRKKNQPRTPAEVAADYERAPEQNRPGADPRAETLGLLEAACDRLRHNAGLFTEADVTKRLLIAVLESMTPAQRAVKRRLG